MYKTSKESRKELQIRLTILIVIVVVLLSIGTFVYHLLEGWSYADSLYFSTISLVSRGFMDKYPTNMWSVLFSVVYLLIGVCILIYAISSFVAYYISFYQDSVEKKAEIFVRKIKNSTKKKKGKWYVIKDK